MLPASFFSLRSCFHWCRHTCPRYRDRVKIRCLIPVIKRESSWKAPDLAGLSSPRSLGRRQRNRRKQWFLGRLPNLTCSQPKRKSYLFLKNTKDVRFADILKTIGTYKRQYRGVISEDHKQIWICFYCEGSSIDWTNPEVRVFDGGTCYFGLRFSIETKTFSHLDINGLA